MFDKRGRIEGSYKVQCVIFTSGRIHRTHDLAGRSWSPFYDNHLPYLVWGTFIRWEAQAMMESICARSKPEVATC